MRQEEKQIKEISFFQLEQEYFSLSRNGLNIIDI